MHSWGDENVDWRGIDEAAWYIKKGLCFWGRIHVSQCKEKFGTVRVYCNFGWDSFYGILQPPHNWIPSWWPWKLDLVVSQWIMLILNKIAIPYQHFIYKLVYRSAVRKWPHLYDEIVSCADFGELFEGSLPGYKHSNYWTELK